MRGRYGSPVGYGHERVRVGGLVGEGRKREKREEKKENEEKKKKK